MPRTPATRGKLSSAEIKDVFKTLKLDTGSGRESFVPPPMPSEDRTRHRQSYHLTASAHSDPPPGEVR